MPPLKSFSKDPLAVLDYSLDWSAWLGSDTISSAAWSAPGLTQPHASAVSGSVTTAWLGGGVAGERYIATCMITTAGGRSDERSIAIQVQNR